MAFWKTAPSISFSGSGFLAVYQLGVVQCFLNIAPWMLRTAPCVLGASAGSLVAAAVVCEISPLSIRDEMLDFAKWIKTFLFGPFHPSVNIFHWLECVLNKYVPSDADRLASGRLAVTVTRLTDGECVVISEFNSKKDVIQALLCSCFVPGYCGMQPPSFKGVFYVDGGFSSIQPVLNETCNSTLTICPFSGETDICPLDTPSMLDMVVKGTTLKVNMANSLRLINALYPMALEHLEEAYHTGYKDAIVFLQSKDLCPSLMLHTVYQNKPWIHLENTTAKNKETAMMTSFTDIRQMQTDSCKKEERTHGVPITKQPRLLMMLQNVLLRNLVIHLTMFGFAFRMLYYLFLHVTSIFYIFQRKQRVESWSRNAPEMVFWTWHALRCFVFFFFNILVSSFMKNIKDRVMVIFLLLQWLNRKADIDHPPVRRSTTLA